MKKIAIWGTGGGAKRVLTYLRSEQCEIIYFLDNNEEKKGMEFLGYKVYGIEELSGEYDYIIISVMKKDIIDDIKEQLENVGVEKEKIISFFDKSEVKSFPLFEDFINTVEWRIFLFEQELEYWKKLVSGLDEKILKLNNLASSMEKPTLYIWGTGAGAKEILDYLYKDKCKLMGFIDNDRKKVGGLFENKPIISIDMIVEKYDYIIIATKIMEFTYSILQQLQEYGVDESKIIPFFYTEKIIIKNEYDCFINTSAWRNVLLSRELYSYKNLYQVRIENLKYEIADEVKNNKVRLPKIAPIDKTLDLIINLGCSIVRYGDGEFGLIDKYRFHKFQKDDDRLAERLGDILKSNDPGCLIAIADNYGSLEKMTERGAESVRNYMTSGAREIQMNLLNLDWEYHNAYLTRPYVYFKDKKSAGRRFQKIKKIWDNKNLLIIEGHQSRLGIGNDLFDNVKSIRRVLGPSTNAFDQYDKILEAALLVEKSALVLVALGPTATVLAYDLYKAGYQAVDIGHIDIEYEWYKLGVENPIKLGNKYVCEAVNGDKVEELIDSEYSKQIIARID